MSHLILSHLSKNNNDPKLVQELFDNCANGINVIVASRYEETPVYPIGFTVYSEISRSPVAIPAYFQATLF
jgi:hypothetical protein